MNGEKKKYVPTVPMTLPLPEGTLNWSELVEDLGKANRALARYAGLLYAMENPRLLLSPFFRDEAVRSNRIEGTRVDTVTVLRSEAGDAARDEAEKHDLREVFNYREAMDYAVSELERRPMSPDFLKGLHCVLLDSVRGEDKSPGKFRELQNYIGSELGGIENARFIPPDPLCVPALMDNWTAYLASTEKDPIVQAAIIHAQFEIIHPFCDGNGRLGRMLLPLFFFSKGVLPAPMFYLSRYLERFETEYKNALLGITATGDWTSWVRFFARAVAAQAEENLAISEKIQTYYRDTKKRILENTRSQHAISLWDAIVATPVFRISSLKLLKAPSRIALMQLVAQFEKMGIIHRIEAAAGRKGALYVCAPLVNIPEQKEIF